MKKSVERIMTVILASVLILHSLFGSAVQVRAMDMETQQDYVEEFSGVQPEPEVETDIFKPSSPVGDGYLLNVNSPVVSLGTLSRGTNSNSYEIKLTNASAKDLNIVWHEADFQQAVNVVAPKNTLVGTGMTVSYFIQANTTLPAGQYKATLIFGDKEDTSYAYGTKVEVSFQLNDPMPYITNVSINPGNVVMTKGSTTQFWASVMGENGADTSVTWTISGQNSAGTRINENGLLSVDPAETSKQLTVVVTSKQDPNKYEKANVVIQDKDYTVSVSANPIEGGNVSGGGTVAQGSNVSVLAAPNITYMFEGWYQNGTKVSSTPSYVINSVNSDMNLVAKFVKNQCYVNVTSNFPEAGRVTQPTFVNYGDSAKLEVISVKDGWKFEGWLENGVYISNSPSLIVNNIISERKIVAVFSQAKYSVNAGVNPKDTGKVVGMNTLNRGSDVKLTAEAYDGYVFKNWTLNGVVIGKEKEYIVRNLSQDYYLVANFEKKDAKNYSINAGVTSNTGYISPSGTTKVQEGGAIVYTINPMSGYRILGVCVDGKEVGAVSSYRFDNVKENHTITASFVVDENAVKNTKVSEETKKKQEENKAKANTEKKQDNKNDSATESKQQEKQPNVQAPDGATEVVKPDTVTPEEALDVDNQVIVEDEHTDEEKVVEEEYDYDSQTGVMQELNLNYDDLENARTDMELAQSIMYEAVTSGLLQVAIFNEFDDSTYPGASGDFINSASLPNVVNVVDSLLTEEEIGRILNGSVVKFNLNIFDNSSHMPEETKSIIDSQLEKNSQIANYFEIVFLKTADSNCSEITATDVGLTICMSIPEQYREEGREFSIIRTHKNANGVIENSILRDEDSNPDTITFTTDKFSEFGLMYNNANNWAKKAMAVGIVSVIVLVPTVVIVIAVCKGTHRRRRKHK